METQEIDIDYLIDIVSQGGAIRTGVDVRNKNGALLIEKKVRISNVNHLLVLKNNGLRRVPMDAAAYGGMWDGKGNPVRLTPARPKPEKSAERRARPDIVKRLDQISSIRKEARTRHIFARKKIQQVFKDVERVHVQVVGGCFTLNTAAL